MWIFGLKEIKRDIFNIEKKNADKFVYLATVTGLWHSCGMTRILWNNIYTIWFDYFLRLLFYKFNNGMKDYNSYSTQSQIKILPLLKIYIYLYLIYAMTLCLFHYYLSARIVYIYFVAFVLWFSLFFLFFHLYYIRVSFYF